MTLPSHAATSRQSMTVERAADLLGIWAPRIHNTSEGWRSIKALLMVAGSESWDAAAALADAMGVHPDDQELIFHQLQREKANT